MTSSLPASLVSTLRRQAVRTAMPAEKPSRRDRKHGDEATPNDAVVPDGETLVVRIPGRPVPKARARTFVDEAYLGQAFQMARGSPERFMSLIRSRSRGGERTDRMMRSITPERTRAYESAVATAVALMMRARYGAGVTFAGPVVMQVELRFVRTAPHHVGFPISADIGDLDNLSKAVLDGMNAVAYRDDRQVVALMLSKAFGDHDETIISISNAVPSPAGAPPSPA